MVKSFVALLIDRFGLHTPVQQLKPGISPAMAASLSREAINVSISVIMVGPNIHGPVIAKHLGGLQTYACSHGNPNQGKAPHFDSRRY
jgi:hypothetical protein